LLSAYTGEFWTFFFFYLADTIHEQCTEPFLSPVNSGSMIIYILYLPKHKMMLLYNFPFLGKQVQYMF